MRVAHNSKLKNQNSKLPQLAEKVLLSLPCHLRSHSLLRAVVRLDHRHRRSEQSLLHPFLNRLRRPLEDIAVLPHPAKQSCASRRIAVAREQLSQLAHQDAAVPVVTASANSTLGRCASISSSFCSSVRLRILTALARIVFSSSSLSRGM